MVRDRYAYLVGAEVNIDEMPAGREMDALVAEKAMGCAVKFGYRRGDVNLEGTEKEPYCYCERRSHYSDCRGETDRFPNIPNYSTDIAAAWEVLEKAFPVVEGQRSGFFAIAFFSDGYKTTFVNEDQEVMSGAYSGKVRLSQAPTAPLAICRAALKAVL